jgi:prepilin signal peptidase PulO-like enzyme (type II secretory pathway)
MIENGIGLIFGAIFFGLAAYIGVQLAGTIKAEPFEDGPRPGQPPIPWIVGGAAVAGAILATHSASSLQVALFAMVTCALAAIWCTDVRYGLVPDIFSLTPLGVILLVAVLQRQTAPFGSALIPFVPFAITALISKGRGMGWGDVKLAALGGAVLGAGTALIAFSIGCLAAVAYAYLRGRRSEPIAFAPYMICAIGIAMPLGAFS